MFFDLKCSKVIRLGKNKRKGSFTNQKTSCPLQWGRGKERKVRPSAKSVGNQRITHLGRFVDRFLQGGNYYGEKMSHTHTKRKAVV